MAKKKKFKKATAENVQDTLDERGKNYGEFEDHAAIAQAVKTAMMSAPRWNLLSNDMKEAWEMVAHKFARAVNGNINYKDNYRDSIGYLQLVLNRLNKKFPKQP